MKNKNKSLCKRLVGGLKKIANWVLALVALDGNNKFCRVMRRVVGVAFALLVVFCAAIAIVKFIDEAGLSGCGLFCGNDDYYLDEQLSDNLFFYDGFYDKAGYLANARDRKVLKNVVWIEKPIEGDSLVCYSDGVHRGFFHMADGRVVVPPIYNHAWVFSEGLAAVELDGRLRFIDTAGRTVIDKLFAYNSSANGYVFHKGHCAVHDSTGKLMGLIDRTGQWVLPPVYQNIFSYDTFWVINNDREQSVLTFGLDTVLPFTRASFEIGDTSITATFADHTQSTYTLQGKLIVAAQIRDVGQMTYNTREVFYCKSGDVNECTEEYEYDTHAETRTAVASCLRYEAEDDWYGLMAPDGRIITPPIYCSIEAVDKDLYLCKTSYGRGVLLNSKGIRVK